MSVFFDKLGNPVDYDGVSPITWRLTVYALAVREGRVLMTEPAWSSRWELPGGEVDPGESLMDGVRRECLEETGLLFTPAGADPVHFGEQFFYEAELASYRHAVIVIFLGTASAGAQGGWAPPPGEIKRAAWVEAAMLHPGNTHPNQWPALVTAGLVKANSE